jgi:alkylhydroperoxidase/carboxymuconolactone decarboxylase family protein YurZ
MMKKDLKIHEDYKGVIDKVPEGWEEIVAKSPMDLSEKELYKIAKAVAMKLKLVGVYDDEKELKGYIKGTLAIKKDFPDLYKKDVITDVAIATDNWDPNKEFFKPKPADPYWPSR